jgi:integrase
VTVIADTTRKQYQRIADNHIRPSLGAVDLAKLTPLYVQQMLDSLASRGVRDRTREYAFGTLRTALNAAIERDLLAVNPCKKSLKPKCKPKEGTALPQEQADRLIEASATGEWEAMIRLAIFSGMRQGELFALTWDDVDFTRSTVHVRHSLQEVDGVLTVKEPKSVSGRRSIMIDSTTLGALQDHRKRAIANGKAFSPLVFSDSHGGHLRKSNFNRKAWQPIKEAAGLESIRFHDLRHTHSTWLIEDGVPLRDVQGRVGHSTPHMTMRYVHRVKQAEDRAQAAMERRAAKNSCSPYVALNGEKADEKDAS